MIATDEATDPEINGSAFEPIRRLDKDLKAAAKLLGRQEVRYLVDTYYQVQRYRIASGAQILATHGETFDEAEEEAVTEPTGLEEGELPAKKLTNQQKIRKIIKAEPHNLLSWTYENMRICEANIQRGLGEFANEYTLGLWLRSICGIGPVISAGLLAHLDITKAPTVGHYWRFAGLDPTDKWHAKKDTLEMVKNVLGTSKKAEPGHLVQIAEVIDWDLADLERDIQNFDAKLTVDGIASVISRRPWNAQLKTLLAFKLGESFVKVQNNKKDYYGKLFAQRKARESQRNASGDFSQQAFGVLAVKKIGKETEAYKAYSQGKLPPAHIHARARRWAVKLFVAHLHQCMYEDWYGKASPFPWVFEHGEGDHRHKLQPPNWPIAERGKSLKEMGE